MHHHLRHAEDSIEAPDHPILNKGVSLKHMIEMTTSGSGSGKNTSFQIEDFGIKEIYVQFFQLLRYLSLVGDISKF